MLKRNKCHVCSNNKVHDHTICSNGISLLRFKIVSEEERTEDICLVHTSYRNSPFLRTHPSPPPGPHNN